MFKHVLKDVTVKTNESLLEIITTNRYGTQSILRLAGWEAVKNRDKGRGVENDLVTLDECAFYPQFQDKFEKVIEPTLLTSKGRLIVTSTPNGFNHFYELYQKAKSDPEWFVSHATSYDNPFNDPKELERLKQKKDPDAFAQEYLADFRRVQGLVYKSFDYERHIAETLPDSYDTVQVVGAVDFGFTNPAAMLRITKDRMGHYWLSHEFYETGKTTPELIQHMHSMKCEQWYPDPAEPDRIEEMRRAGIRVMEVSKDVKAGIDTVQTLLRENRLHIHKSCKNLLFEINNYRWREQGHSNIDLNEPELPIKENDHLLDAARYALHMMETVGKGSQKIQEFYKTLQQRSVVQYNEPNQKPTGAPS